MPYEQDMVVVHTGSLENLIECNWNPFSVHCRTGSLENIGSTLRRLANVHCRTGSLEMKMF